MSSDFPNMLAAEIPDDGARRLRLSSLARLPIVPISGLPAYLQRVARVVEETPVTQTFSGATTASLSGRVLLTRYVALAFLLVFWLRKADPENDWKGPREK